MQSRKIHPLVELLFETVEDSRLEQKQKIERTKAVIESILELQKLRQTILIQQDAIYKKLNLRLPEIELERFAEDELSIDAIKEGRTALIQGIVHNDNCIELLELFIKAGANINLKAKDIRPPLYFVAEEGEEEEVKLLLDSKAIPDNKILSAAIGNSSPNIIKLLLEAKVTPNTEVLCKAICIFESDDVRSIDKVVALLDAKADPNQLTSNQITVLTEAIITKNNNQLVIALLKANTNPNIPQNINSLALPLIQAIRQGNLDIVNTLLAAKADPNISYTDNGGLCLAPLNYAAFNGHAEVLRTLLKAGAIPDKKDIAPPLIGAAAEGKEEIVHLLLNEAHVNPNRMDHNEDTPLHWAAYKGHENVVAKLIEAKAEIEKNNKKGNTPLHEAIDRIEEYVSESRLATIYLLLNSNAIVHSSVLINRLLRYMKKCNQTDMRILMCLEKIYQQQNRIREIKLDVNDSKDLENMTLSLKDYNNLENYYKTLTNITAFYNKSHGQDIGSTIGNYIDKLIPEGVNNIIGSYTSLADLNLGFFSYTTLDTALSSAKEKLSEKTLKNRP